MAINYIENMDPNIVPELAWKTLACANAGTLLPFRLLLNDTDGSLYCEHIIRIVPGKRLVAFSRWGGKEVVAKLFYERGKAKRHLKRDVNGIHALIESNVPTPRLLYEGSASNERIQIALFEKISPAKNLEMMWQEEKNTLEFAALLREVTVELATQHVLGILQRDLHLKNFLVKENVIYTLDGGNIEKYPGILNKHQSMDHLSLFFSQLGAGAERLQCELFNVYIKARGWIVDEADFDLLKKMTAKKNKERWMRYQKKIVRTCSSFSRVNQVGRSMIYDREYEGTSLTDFLYDPEKFFMQPDIVFLKKGRSATVIKVMLGDRTWVVKRYNIKNGWHWLRRCVRATRAATSWRLAQRLRLFGISTAKPVAYVENKFCGLRGKSYFVMEYVAGQHVGEFFSDCNKDEECLSTMAVSVVNMLNQLRELKITHGDLKMTNILVADKGPVLIDLDGMREHAGKFKFKQAATAEIERFMRNWYNDPRAAAVFRALL